MSFRFGFLFCFLFCFSTVPPVCFSVGPASLCVSLVFPLPPPACASQLITQTCPSSHHHFSRRTHLPVINENQAQYFNPGSNHHLRLIVLSALLSLSPSLCLQSAGLVLRSRPHGSLLHTTSAPRLASPCSSVLRFQRPSLSSSPSPRSP